LVTLVLAQNGQYEEVVQVLESKNLGIDSSIAKGDWVLISRYLEALKKLGHFEKISQTCQRILAEGSGFHGDDWIIWQSLNQAAHELDDEE
jgi:hypothetical protein